MTTAEQRVRILKDENRRMERYLHGLPEEAWQHPTPCAEWMVADVIAHITSFNIVQPARIAEAAGIFEEVALSEQFVEFLTLPAYEHIDL